MRMRNRVKRRLILTIVFVALAVSHLRADDVPDALAGYNSGDYETAVRICLEELKLEPRSRDSYAVLCWSLVALGRYQEALEYATQAYSFAPYDPRIVEVLGEAHFYLGRNLEALELFELYTVIADTGGRIDRVYYFMGEIFVRLKEYNNADIAFSTALYHSPNVSAWWSRLGYAREMAADYEHALQAYNKALSLNPNLLDADRGRTRVQSARDQG